MITLQHLSYQYPEVAGQPLARPALDDLSLHVEEGELLLVMGPSGAGKSTFLRCLNGLVPHFHGGTLSGFIRVAGCDPVTLGPQEMSRVVGMVFQEPETQFVADHVEDELAFGLENRAMPRNLMRKRVEEVLDQLSIAHLRNRAIETLSGGEKQRVAIAGVLTTHPQVLVLDEPTSQLDPQSAEEVLVAIRRLNEDLGLTIVLAEHRLERVVQFVDRVLYLPGGGQQPLLDSPQVVMGQVPLAPPLVILGKALGWQPLPLTVKQARRHVRRGDPGGVSTSQRSIRSWDGSTQGNDRWADLNEARQTAPIRDTVAAGGVLQGRARRLSSHLAAELSTLLGGKRGQMETPGATPLVRAEDLWYGYPGGRQALRGVTLQLYPGQVVALMGRNGSGKTTLLKLLVGLLKPGRGSVRIWDLESRISNLPIPDSNFEVPTPAFLDTRSVPVRDIARRAGYVPQNPGALLFKDTVLEELAFTRQGHGLDADPAADEQLLARVGLAHAARRYPRDLSTGERQRVALAAILVADPSLLLLDEPTRGLDYGQKEALTEILLGLASQGRSVLLATHDVELAARCAQRVVLMGDGEIVVDGPTREVMTGSLVFASQVNKLYRSPQCLVVEDLVPGGQMGKA